MEKPVDFYPTAEDFVGEGGNFERPYAIVKMQRVSKQEQGSKD